MSIISELLKEVKTDKLDEQVIEICDKIIEEEKETLEKLEEKPKTSHLLLALPCPTSKRELSFLCLEKEIGYYVVCLMSKLKGKEAPFKRVKTWDVKEYKPERIFKRYAEILKHYRGDV